MEVVDSESGELIDIVRKCSRSMNRRVRDTDTGMTLMERTGKLIPETW